MTMDDDLQRVIRLALEAANAASRDNMRRIDARVSYPRYLVEFCEKIL